MQRPQLSRRVFLKGAAAALGASQAARLLARQDSPGSSDDLRSLERRIAQMGTRLRERYRDLRQHFIFEYYPWYHNGPVAALGRIRAVFRPAEVSASSLPLLGAYDSRAGATRSNSTLAGLRRLASAPST